MKFSSFIEIENKINISGYNSSFSFIKKNQTDIEKNTEINQNLIEKLETTENNDLNNFISSKSLKEKIDKKYANEMLNLLNIENEIGKFEEKINEKCSKSEKFENIFNKMLIPIEKEENFLKNNLISNLFNTLDKLLRYLYIFFRIIIYTFFKKVKKKT